MTRCPTLAVLLIAGMTSGIAQAQTATPGGAVAMLASADPAKGETIAKRCAACHTFDKGGANKVGPHLYGVVNRPVASVEGYNYSDAMKKFSENGTKTWTFQELDTYLIDPKKHVPGTKMVFPGLKKDDERANVIAYLRALSDQPAPLPTQ